jgi:hypothetical protein
MQELLRGIGQLEKWERPDGLHEVSFHFTVTSDVVQRPGFPRVAAKKHAEGHVRSTGGESFPEGSYRLYAEDEVLKVRNLGLGTWTIEAS